MSQTEKLKTFKPHKKGKYSMNATNDFNSVGRFSDRVANYIKYRPHYPLEIISFLYGHCGFDKTKIVADIGSGPGISCEHFVANGNTVYAVEPNDKMRNAAEEIFSNSKNFISTNGLAESTTLESKSVDFIVAGQAFHWFDKEKCKVEFKRILRNDGYVILMWNEKTSSNDFMISYYDLLKRYGSDYEKVNHANVDGDGISEFYSPESFSLKTFEHTHPLDYDALEGRLLSSSYIPLAGEKFDEMIIELKKMFEKYNANALVDMEYETRLYYGKLNQL